MPTPSTSLRSNAATSVALASDDVLLGRIRAGDVEAFGALYERHRAGASRLARRLVREPAIAAE